MIPKGGVGSVQCLTLNILFGRLDRRNVKFILGAAQFMAAQFMAVQFTRTMLRSPYISKYGKPIDLSM
ncbi:hypothetical protein C7B76_00555 [filamentous cyanobacterium CCP2]|nr:hypothetical protein C7B76_00555 [filamentous cyanobacterium CCP2]